MSFIYDKDGRPCGSKYYDRPKGHLDALGPNKSKLVELVAELMQDIPDSYWECNDPNEFYRDRLEGLAKEHLKRNWRAGIHREDWKLLAAHDFEDDYRDDFGWDFPSDVVYW